MSKYTEAAHYDYYEGEWDDESFVPFEALNYLGLTIVDPADFEEEYV